MREVTEEDRKRTWYRYLKTLREVQGLDAGATQILDEILRNSPRVPTEQQLIEVIANKDIITKAVAKTVLANAQDRDRPSVKIPHDPVKLIHRAALSKLKGDYGLHNLITIAERIVEAEDRIALETHAAKH